MYEKEEESVTKYTEGWDITLWVGEDREKVEEIFSAVMDFVVEKFDQHPDNEPCVLSWVASMHPAEFEDEGDAV